MEEHRMPKVVAELKFTPLGTKSPSLSQHIARGLNALKKSKIKFTIGPNGTTLEGELKDVLEAVESAHNAIFSKEVQRVATLLSIDDRRDKVLTAAGKLKSIKAKLK
jgi:uncharacterized protein (TIGR00106 family)